MTDHDLERRICKLESSGAGCGLIFVFLCLLSIICGLSKSLENRIAEIERQLGISAEQGETK
jgi:uncharacterized coiled-coil protein SlyX